MVIIRKATAAMIPEVESLYVILDVTFLESKLFFSESHIGSSLHGEKLIEEQSTNDGENWPFFEDNSALNDFVGLTEESEKHGVSIQEDVQEGPEYTHEQLTGQIVTQSLVPHEDQSHEGIPEVQSLNSTPNNELDCSSTYKLSFKHNRGQPPNRYSPNLEERKQNTQ